MMIRNAFWIQYINDVFMPQIDTFRVCLCSKVLPAFDNLQEEAEKLGNKLYGDLSSMPAGDDNFDLGSIAESAQGRAIDYYVTMSNMRQGIICLFTSGLYHLFEQQLFLFYRKEILTPAEENNKTLMKFEELEKRFKSKGVEIKSFKAYSKINIIRLIGNVIKHAEGSSSDDLRRYKPEYFKLGNSFPVNIQIFQPLAGNDLKIPESISDFDTKRPRSCV